MADIGEGIKEVEVLQWHVQVGDKLQEFDPVCTVQSDKASVEITSRYAGTITKLGPDLVQVGEPLLFLESVVSDPVIEEQTAEDMEDLNTTCINDSSCAITGSSVTPVKAPAATAMGETFDPTKSAPFEKPRTPTLTNGQRMSPAVRKLVHEYGISVDDISGTGPDGRILKRDVLASIHNDPIHTPLRGYARTMFMSMTEALSKPHMVLTEELELKSKSKILPQFLKRLSDGLKQVPQLNSVTSKNELFVHASHNFGIAKDTPHGLVVPVIRHVESKTVDELAAELEEIKSTDVFTSDQLTDCTFTISNIGSLAGLHATPVLGGGSVGMVVLGRVQRLPRYVSNDSDEVVPTFVLPVSYCGDHRFVDGASLARLHASLLD